MKTITLAAGLALTAAVAHAQIVVGRGEISATIDATATYDSNVFGSHNATSDYSGTLSPRVFYQRKAGLLEAEASAGISFIHYVDLTQLNSNNLDLHAALKTSSTEVTNFTGALTAAYVESSDINPDLNTRIRSKTALFTGRSSLVTGSRTDVVVNASYSDSQHSIGSNQQYFTSSALWDYKDFFYDNSLNLSSEYDRLTTSGDNALGVPLDQTSYTFSVGFNRSLVSEAFRIGVTYGYRILDRSQAETPAGNRRQGGSVLTLTLNGPFLPEKYFPKIKSEFSLTYQDAATPGINDTGTKELTGSLKMSWQARESTSVTFGAQRDQRLSVNDLTVVTTSVQLGVSQVLRYNLTGSLGVAYSWSTYPTLTRKDETASANAGLQYHFAKSWDANFSYVLNSTKSTLVQSTYDRNLVNLGLTYHF